MSAPVVERDYVLTHIMQALGQLEPPAGLVFKGGTALRLCFYEDYRYSADLDFSLVELRVSDAFGLLRRALESCALAIGLPQLVLPDADPLLIRYVGPLGGAREIKLDFADDELVLETTSRALILRYTDQREDAAALPTYTLEEIAAEKLRCIIQRLLCRDISDLHRLFVREGIEIETVWLRAISAAAVRNIGARSSVARGVVPNHAALAADASLRSRGEHGAVGDPDGAAHGGSDGAPTDRRELRDGLGRRGRGPRRVWYPSAAWSVAAPSGAHASRRVRSLQTRAATPDSRGKTSAA